MQANAAVIDRRINSKAFFELRNDGILLFRLDVRTNNKQRIVSTMKVSILMNRLATRLMVSALGISLMASSSFAADEGKELPPPKDEPKVINPGPPPSDAIVLFDGKDLSKWEGEKSGDAKWKVEDGVATINGTGTIKTKQAFGDCQLHVEWASPAKVEGEGQGRGNSGVYFQGRYEIQVLDSYNNPTYFHGQAGSLYKQHAPLVNASRKPGEWQYYDIIFHAPRFDAEGKLTKPGTVTVLHNGVLVQDNAEILGTTSHVGAPKYTAHAAKESLSLQDHHNPVRYRNIWIREL
ncbi:MAG: hypothetical protein JWQ71_2217 [Pedosphaera sp.]|nr:hypothetical protein [Pedosphaera sp.]